MEMDPLGNLCLIPGVICLLLALQWGGTAYAWSDGRIIAPLVLAGLLLLGFISIQIYLKDKGTIPLRVIKQRSIAAGVVFTLFVTAAMISFIYYLPIWLQATKEASPVHSGVLMLPTVISSAASSLAARSLINRFGYYTPFMIWGSMLMAVGAGLLTTFTPSTGPAKWIGYQIIWALGNGMSMQQASLAAKAVLPRPDAPIGMSLIFFAQPLGEALFVSVDEAIFSNALAANLSDIPGLSQSLLTNTGSTSLRGLVDSQNLPRLLGGHNDAVVNVFRVALAASCACAVASSLMEWKSVKPQKREGREGRGGPGGPRALGAGAWSIWRAWSTKGIRTYSAICSSTE